MGRRVDLPKSYINSIPARHPFFLGNPMFMGFLKKAVHQRQVAAVQLNLVEQAVRLIAYLERPTST